MGRQKVRKAPWSKLREVAKSYGPLLPVTYIGIVRHLLPGGDPQKWKLSHKSGRRDFGPEPACLIAASIVFKSGK
jgi:hypothetical protein